MQKTGFTLAEVLIVLAIIGVIAALSIPGLIQDSQDTELVIRAKKAQYMLSEAYRKYSIENDCAGDLSVSGIAPTETEESA